MCLLGPEHWNFERSPKIHHGETHFLGVLTFFFIRNTQNMGFPMINFWAPFKKSIFRTQSTQNSLWINSTQICRYVHFWCRNWPDYLLVYTCCLSYILLLILVFCFIINLIFVSTDNWTWTRYVMVSWQRHYHWPTLTVVCWAVVVYLFFIYDRMFTLIVVFS